MNNILFLDPSVGSLNKGDEIIMECVREEMMPLFADDFVLNLPTQVSPFHCYQVMRNSLRVQTYSNCKYKFVGGSNLLVPDLRTHFPQWNINIFNYQPLKNSVLVGVGAGAGAEGKINAYTRYIYQHLLSKNYIHSVRDERSKQYVERLGLKAINTGCVTMWKLTPEFCASIPKNKADIVVFTLTPSVNPERKEKYQFILDILLRNYRTVVFWPQGINDMEYFLKLNSHEMIKVLPATVQSYARFLSDNDTDYVGTRLHGGVYAMRHSKRSVIVSIDERARAIHESNNLNCIDINDISLLSGFINKDIATKISLDFDIINTWKSQFING